MKKAIVTILFFVVFVLGLFALNSISLQAPTIMHIGYFIMSYLLYDLINELPWHF